jgi:hypothetical protein
MIYRSEDAHKYWCPHIRTQDESDHDSRIAVNLYFLDARRRTEGATNATGSTNSADYGCIGQRCSQWRWFAKSTPIYEPDVPVGYCGLAGRPDSELYVDMYF